MNEKKNIELDKWDLELDEVLENLKQCQVLNDLTSCSPCSKFFECDLRHDYVKAVYASMSKGSSGGFEF